MNDFNSIKKLLKKEITQTNKVLFANLKSDITLINQISNYIINAGGKHLRHILLLLCAKMTGYKGEHHYLMAVVIELIHTATLLHDDVIDEAAMRRGKVAANNIWGNASSVLVGDFLYSRAFEMMIAPNSMRIMQILSKTTNDIARGEVLQLINRKNIQLSKAEYLDIIQCKTAYLFQAAAQIGAILSATNQAQEHALKNYGKHLGIAYQIVDDVLDYTSQNDIIGKQVASDLAEGRVTLPIIYAFKKATPDEQKILKNAIKNADNSKIEIINNILKKVNAFDYALKHAQKSINLAKESLTVFKQSDCKDALVLLCDLSIKRKK